ncbi:TetR/AcrR family transcriptional regulator [Kitasatospora sp. NBC_01287]|uniref:TetR/AcrR family transcriptional regulator n=1 Tax=Kitasatospora sp. NBC_01287 TaxID=2903573 RepID=UPI002255A5CF|nr:TetR/AcrR family transcriptional regulator [Kitasatospora sp. NBC_01287]MCX4749452.1 TetR/AcrR family transcriptional regulator [Kitasatospora sp. NBC_01287]
MDTDRQATLTAPAQAAPLCAVPRRGRPRSEAAEQAICEAVERLMTEGGSLADLTIEGIAQAAGVGKATIYRRWPNKEALLVDVLVRLEEPEPLLPGTSARDDLVVILDFMRRRGLAKRSRWVLRVVLDQMHSMPALKEVYYEQVVLRRRRAIHQVVARGVAAGEFRADLEVELLAEMLIGPMLLRSVLWDDSPLDDPELPATIVDSLLDGLRGPAHSAGTV